MTDVALQSETIAARGFRGRMRRVAVGAALDYVFGYTVCNDVSARDVQFSESQWTRGKSFDTFCPLGPVVVTADEIPDPQVLALGTRVNGEVLQDSSTGEMLFGVAELLAFCSRSFTLEPGDLLLTGTPWGSGYFLDPPRALELGDVVQAESQLGEHHLREEVFFLGNVPNLEEIVGASDLFLLPSEHESFGMAALEAMASEVPVIATRAGGVPELITDGENGYLFPVGDVDSMAARAIQILSNPELQKRLGRNARETAERKFNESRIVPVYRNFYERVMNTSMSSRA